MNVRLYFRASSLPKEVGDAAWGEHPTNLKRLTVDGKTFTVYINDGAITKDIEQKGEIPLPAWELVESVSLRDKVSDPAMTENMRSGEYELPDGTTGTVRLRTIAAGNVTIVEADISLQSPTWEGVTALHRDILFGRKPERPYAPEPPAESD